MEVDDVRGKFHDLLMEGGASGVGRGGEGGGGGGGEGVGQDAFRNMLQAAEDKVGVQGR